MHTGFHGTTQSLISSYNFQNRTFFPMSVAISTTTSPQNNCTRSINSCINGRCNNFNGECECNNGFKYNGTTCVQLNACQFAHSCFTGKCTAVGLNDFACNCTSNLALPAAACAYSGDCVLDDDCNNGTCIKYIEGNHLHGKCYCKKGYSGRYCEQLLDPCKAKPETCSNCQMYGTDYYCECERGEYELTYLKSGFAHFLCSSVYISGSAKIYQFF